jgi:hypothetical protein
MECDGRLDMSTKLGLQMGLGFVALASMASPASAFIVLTVGGDSSCGYAFIQDAIDAAHDSPGEDYIAPEPSCA